MPQPKASVRLFFVATYIPLILALVTWLIPIFVMVGIDQRIGLLELKDDLTDPEQKMLNDLKWRKSWWITEQTTLFNPIAATLLVAFLALIVVWLAWRFA